MSNPRELHHRIEINLATTLLKDALYDAIYSDDLTTFNLLRPASQMSPLWLITISIRYSSINIFNALLNEQLAQDINFTLCPMVTHNKVTRFPLIEACKIRFDDRSDQCKKIVEKIAPMFNPKAIDAQNEDGTTALHQLFYHQSPEDFDESQAKKLLDDKKAILATLIDFGANPYIINDEGGTALDYDDELADFYKQYSATTPETSIQLIGEASAASHARLSSKLKETETRVQEEKAKTDQLSTQLASLQARLAALESRSNSKEQEPQETRPTKKHKPSPSTSLTAHSSSSASTSSLPALTLASPFVSSPYGPPPSRPAHSPSTSAQASSSPSALFSPSSRIVTRKDKEDAAKDAANALIQLLGSGRPRTYNTNSG